MQVSGRPLGQQTGQAPVKPLSGRSWLTRGETTMPCGPCGPGGKKYPMKKKKKGNPHATKKKKKKGKKNPY